jgi:hypothetical protein
LAASLAEMLFSRDKVMDAAEIVLQKEVSTR